MDKSTVSRIVVLFNETGTVSKRQYPDSHSASHRKLTEVDKLMIIEIALDKPGIYLGEIKQCLLEEHGTDVSVSTICKYLYNEAGFTRQKMIITAKQRSEVLRLEYITDMCVYVGHPDLFVFVDETGADGRDRMRRFGYSLRGKPAVANKLLFRGQHTVWRVIFGGSNFREKSTYALRINFRGFNFRDCTVRLPTRGAAPTLIE